MHGSTHANEKPLLKRSNRRALMRTAAIAGGGLIFSSRLFQWLSPKALAATHDFDAVVVGSGAAGMTAALAAAHQGLKTLLIEKSPCFGGSTARSGGGLWIRNNEIILAAGVPDSPALAATYLAEVAGDAVSQDRQSAFLEHGPKMLRFIMDHTPLKFRFMEDYPDYYPERPGGMEGGASIEPEGLDGRILGDELKNLNAPYIPTPPGIVVDASDHRWLTLAAVNIKGVAVAAKAVSRYLKAKLHGEKPLTMGQALAAGLRAGLMQANVPLWLNTELLDLELNSSGRVTGLTVKKSGRTMRILAKHGVVVASGGFEHNLKMRTQHQRLPIGTEWTVGARENTGDGIQAGERIGAHLELMDEAWWGPTIPLPDQPYFCLAERTLPGSILVNGSGLRFVNEAAPYHDVVNAMYEDESKNGIPAWLITDQNYRNRYLFKDVLPALPLPEAWYRHGAVYREWSLERLAERIGLAPHNLTETVARFNRFAESGEDLDFGRGKSAYDRYYTDPSVSPNPALGKLWLPPFYAFKIVPGDLGTKGGMATDAYARVLRADGRVIEGLYAAGNASASVMGRSYAGAGSTLGPAMTFGFIAAQTMANQS